MFGQSRVKFALALLASAAVLFGGVAFAGSSAEFVGGPTIDAAVDCGEELFFGDPPPAVQGYEYVGIIEVEGILYWYYEQINGPGWYRIPVDC